MVGTDGIGAWDEQMTAESKNTNDPSPSRWLSIIAAMLALWATWWMAYTGGPESMVPGASIVGVAFLAMVSGVRGPRPACGERAGPDGRRYQHAALEDVPGGVMARAESWGGHVDAAMKGGAVLMLVTWAGFFGLAVVYAVWLTVLVVAGVIIALIRARLSGRMTELRVDREGLQIRGLRRRWRRSRPPRRIPWLAVRSAQIVTARPHAELIIDDKHRYVRRRLVVSLADGRLKLPLPMCDECGRVFVGHFDDYLREARAARAAQRAGLDLEAAESEARKREFEGRLSVTHAPEVGALELIEPDEDGDE